MQKDIYAARRHRATNKHETFVRRAAAGTAGNSVGYQDSGRPTNPLFLSNKNNELQRQKTGSSMPLNVLGGYRWPSSITVERDLLRKVIKAEIGELS